MTSGVASARSDRSIARVIFSPTTAPMLPPMNFHSMAQMFTRRPSSVPPAEISASDSEVALRMPASRSEYGFESTKSSGSVEVRPASNSS